MEGHSSDDYSIPGHKLCGFLCVVLSFELPEEISQKSDTLEDLCFGLRCHIFRSGSEVAFRASNGFVFSPLDSNNAIECVGLESGAKPAGNIGKTKKKSYVEMGNGIASLLHSLHLLVSQKCFRIVSTVTGVASGENGNGRAVMLIDVHLPFLLWTSCQFPKWGPTAAKLFRHLSCDWQQRSSILFSKEGCHGYLHAHGQSIWNLPDCHVVGCKLHCGASCSSNRKLFDLHEIFNSVASTARKKNSDSSRVEQTVVSSCCGIWELSDDVLGYILSALSPIDLVRIGATCRHLRSVAFPIMPCVKLKLFPHQQIAVGWMLQREKNAEEIPDPLYMCFLTEDGFSFYIHSVSGKIITGIVPVINDFHGGMFCDEPGLGKTITALSLILKTQGTVADPPDGAQVIWCTHNANYKCGYYEFSGYKINGIKMSLGKRLTGQIPDGGHFRLNDYTPSSTKRARTMSSDSYSGIEGTSCSMPTPCVARSIKGLSHIKRNLFNSYEEAKSKNINNVSMGTGHLSVDLQLKKRNGLSHNNKTQGSNDVDHFEYNDHWVRCDSCQKWRKLEDTDLADSTAAWFCSMNTDPSFQSCAIPEEMWDYRETVTYFPGFYTKGTFGGNHQNVSLFTDVLKEHYALMNIETKRALVWLTKLSIDKLSVMETIGLVCPIYDTSISSREVQGFHKIFEAFGLAKKVVKGVSRWFYPKTLNNLVFDLPALRIAIRERLDSFRLYLSGATLVVVPSNLVDHWITQIDKHVKPGQLRVYVWTDHKKPSPHCLAWDYDIVITTFPRLSAEWAPHKRSALMQVHWLRVMLDEGHTLGSSLAVTNKLQMAVSLTSSNRWVLTGTPTPNTPNNQLSHLQPMLKFLHEEAYGQNQKSWQVGILKPFEAEMDEGRSRLIQLLFRCMIIARKIDVHTIPPCIKKATYLNFTEEHARSYNELVVTVQRNILMADWNDPSHVESLLNPKQWKFRSSTISNIRLSCCVAGHIKVTDAGQDIQETMDILIENGLDPKSQEHDEIKYNLLYGGKCMRCTEWCRLPVITPCRHLLCLVCVALNNEKCTFPGCGNLYEMQSPEILTRPENPNPKWPVPKDLIELQPSYKQDDWDPDWQSTSSSKVAYLVHSLKALQDPVDGIGYSEMHTNELHSSTHGCRPYVKKTSKDKVLIFSQFLEHIHVIEQQLTIVGVKFVGMYSPMHSSKKIESLSVFQHDSSCVALLMDGSAALGLDLSFVTRVFLMEPIWDRSMEEQVISRAHRMGATRPVHVETLVMRGTIEEQMLEFLQDTDERKKLLKEDFVKPAHGAHVCRTLHDFAERNYLARLSFVRTISPNGGV